MIYTVRRALRRADRVLLALLALALIVRLALIAGGVQNTPDDIRYLRALALLQVRDFSPLLTFYDHLGYTVLAIFPASLQRLISLASGTSINDLYAVPAIWFALFSVGNIAALYALARRMGGGRREARLTAALATGSASLFYWVNTTLPYDISLFLALIGLLIALPGPHPRRIVGGLLLTCAVLTYNAHWLLAAACGLLVLAAHRQRIGTAVRLAIGGAIPLLALSLAAGGAYLTGVIAFSMTATQGVFAEGPSLILEWMIAAEGPTLILWGGAIALALAEVGRGGEPGRARLWILAIVVVAAGLVVGSAVLERFVVYGRTARQIIPFAVLLAGYGLARLPERAWGDRLIAAAISLLALPMLGSAFGFASPRAVESALCAQGQPFARVVTVNQSVFPDDGQARIVLTNTRALYPVTGIIAPPPGRIIGRWRHVIAHPPQHYEGYSAEERAILRADPPEMLLIDTGRAVSGDPAPCVDGIRGGS